MTLTRGLVLACTALAAAAPTLAEDRGWQRTTTPDGTKLSYRLVAPTEERDSYPVLLALPPGPQTVGMVEWGLDLYYIREAEARGWVVVSPAAPGGQTFVLGAEKYLPELLAEVAESYPPEGGKFHVAGVSNGGRSSFRIAILHPELFHSIATLPGWPTPSDLDRLGRIAEIPLRMWAGEQENPAWLELMRTAETLLQELDGNVELSLFPGEGHTLRRLAGGRALFDFLESTRPEGQ
ncbi:MAG: hypothetical protein VYE73_17100 [Acidobacteriota bacterium]|nr:hypothetical protein [Acidobacteriota bacterium]